MNFLPLSPREIEVLELYERGLTYKEIAQALGISVHTVTSYRDRILVKTLVNSRPVTMRRAAWLRRL